MNELDLFGMHRADHQQNGLLERKVSLGLPFAIDLERLA